MSNTDPTKNRVWTPLLEKGKQFIDCFNTVYYCLRLVSLFCY
jgi:hypothetical protein